MCKLKKCVALVVAAGIGSRCNISIPKQYIKLAGEPVLLHVIKKFLASQYIDYVRVVINRNHESFYRNVVSSIVSTKLMSPVYGGASRQNSVRLGLESLQTDYVMIHDACRPFVSHTLIERLIESMRYEYTGVVPVIDVEDTVSLVDSGSIQSTICRKKLRAIQTPQIFNFAELLLCHQSTKESFTDDSSLMMAYKKHVAIIQGEKGNFKLTTEEDLNMVTAESKYRVGSGYDIHRFKSSAECLIKKCLIKICGVEVESEMAIEAHSDGDVAIHAIVDAILGALGCGDIGEHFSPDDPQWKNCNSSYFLNFAAEKAKEKGYSISNLDITVVCEKPKISPHKIEMRKSVAKVLKISDELVNIKATTAEKLGSIGRAEGIAAYATVLLYSFK